MIKRLLADWLADTHLLVRVVKFSVFNKTGYMWGGDLLHPPDRSLLGRVHLKFATVLRLVREALELMVAIRSEAALALLGTRLQVRELWQEVLSVVGLVELGLVRRRHLLVLDPGPVDLLKPRVRLNLLGICRPATQSLIGVLVQQFDAQVSSIILQKVIVELRLRILDILIELVPVFTIEGRQSDEHLVDDGTERPPVRRLAMPLPLEHLR